jgi:hypothetical protein
VAVSRQALKIVWQAVSQQAFDMLPKGSELSIISFRPINPN